METTETPQIKHIIHIADIHIPNSETNRPFSEMLNSFLKQLVSYIKENGYKQEETRIIICGDTYDRKLEVTNEAREMFHNMLNYLNRIAKTYLVAGNHDLSENRLDRTDSLTPSFSIKGVYPNVHYIDKELNYKSGYIIDGNVIFALFSMHEAFAAPNLDGLRDMYPDKRIVGLYHGDVAGSVTDVGRMSSKGIDTDLFAPCDCVMAGHIHKYQTLKKNGVPIVYAGSLFQKAMDENTTGHGFVDWDMEDMSYKHVEIENKYKFYKFVITSYEDIANDCERLLNL